MRGFQIKIVVWPVKICRHRRNEIRAILARKCLAKFHAGDFRNRIGFIRRLKWSTQQCALRNRLRREFGIDAGTPKKKKLAHAALVRGGDDVVLDAEILEQEFHGLFVVRLDSSYFRSRENHDLRFFVAEEFRHRFGIAEIKLAPVALEQLVEARRFKAANERAADHPTVTRDKDLF